MADFSDTRLSPDVIEEGCWFTFYEDIEFRIASAKSESFQKRLSRIGSSARKGFRVGASTTKSDNELARRIMVEELCKGWRSDAGDGVITVSGRELQFSPSAAVELLMSPEYVAAYEWLEGIAVDAAEFADETRARRAGNSASGSSGTSATGRKKSSPPS